MTSQKTSTISTTLFAIAVFLLAINLRPAIIAVGPVIEIVQKALQTTPIMMGVAGTLPVFAFAICSPFIATLARRYSAEKTILASLIIIGIGCIVRSSFSNIWSVLLGTFILCAGIAVGNVLLSSVIRHHRPQYVERLTALQMLAFSLSSAIASGVAVPMAHWFNWQTALGIWGITVIPAFIVWWKLGQQTRPQNQKTSEQPQKPVWQGNIWKSPLAWKISIYMGLQSMMFYTLANWLPALISARGFSEIQAGGYGTIFQFVAFPTALALAPLAERFSIRYLLPSSCLFILVGFIMLWYAPTSLMWLSTTLLGIGGCASFTFCLMLFAIRGKDAAQSAALSGMAQTVGYLIASVGPVSIGYLYQLSGNWQMPIHAMTAIIIIQLMLSVFASKKAAL